MHKIASDFDKTDSVMGIFLYKKYDFFVGDIFSYYKKFFSIKKIKTLGKSTGAACFLVCDFWHN